MRPPRIYSNPGLRRHEKVDEGSVMIWVIRSVLPSSVPPSVGKDDFPAAEAKAVTLKTSHREGKRES